MLLVGLPTLAQKMAYNHVGEDGVTVVGNNPSGVPTNATIPFSLVCRNPGLALPLIALQYHEVKSKPYLFSII